MSAVEGLVDALERIKAAGTFSQVPETEAGDSWTECDLCHGENEHRENCPSVIAEEALAAFREGKPLADDRDMCEAIHGAVMYKRDSPDYRERYGNARAALAFIDAHVLGRRAQGGR